jgi:hypothetical protein
LIDARVLNYIAQPEFESLYKSIRHAEQTLNGFMPYVRRQRAGTQEYGDKKIHEDQAEYEINSADDNMNENTVKKAI